MQASSIDHKRNDLTNDKFIQVNFVLNIRTMLEKFIGLYELRYCTFQEVFLRPFSPFEIFKPDDDWVIKKAVSVWPNISLLSLYLNRLIFVFIKFQKTIAEKMHRKCELSILAYLMREKK